MFSIRVPIRSQEGCGLEIQNSETRMVSKFSDFAEVNPISLDEKVGPPHPTIPKPIECRSLWISMLLDFLKKRKRYCSFVYVAKGARADLCPRQVLQVGRRIQVAKQQASQTTSFPRPHDLGD